MALFSNTTRGEGGGEGVEREGVGSEGCEGEDGRCEGVKGGEVRGEVSGGVGG